MKQFFSNMLGGKKSNRRRKSRDNQIGYGTLEERHLRAGIFFDNASGDLFIYGDEGNNDASLVENGSNLLATVDNVGPQTYSKSQVKRVVFIGLDGNDNFDNRSTEASLMLGGNGDDLLMGGAGYDHIKGGAGNDEIYGGAGNDRLDGGAGEDDMYGEDGNDLLLGGAGWNLMYGDKGNDLIIGGDDWDDIYGGDGEDVLVGLGGADLIETGAGGVPGSNGVGNADLVIAGAGDDEVIGGKGLNIIYGGSGDDLIKGYIYGENRLHGQSGNDDITGGQDNDYITGSDGNDTISAMGGDDYIIPGTGNDTVSGGTGIDMVVYTGSDYKYSHTTTKVVDNRSITLNDGTDSILLVDQLKFYNRIVKPGETNQASRETLAFSNSDRAFDYGATQNSKKLYAFTAPISGKLRIKLQQSGTSLKSPTIEIRTTSGSLITRQSADGAGNINFTLNVSHGTKYHLDVLGSSGSNGSFQVELYKSATQDTNSGDRESLRFSGSNRAFANGATVNGKKLYSFTSPISGKLRIKLASYSSSWREPTIEIRSKSGSLIKRVKADAITGINFTLNVSSGTEYYLDVLGSGGSNGSFGLEMYPSSF